MGVSVKEESQNLFSNTVVLQQTKGILRTPVKYNQPVRLLVSASPNQSANNVFLLNKTSTSQPKSA